MANTLSLSRVKNRVNYYIDRNLQLEENGELPIALSLEASAGIGKTSIITQIAKERGMNLTTIRMSQLEEPGDLIGYPVVEYECQMSRLVKDKDGKVVRQINPKTVWLTTKQLDSPSKNGVEFSQTGKKRMNYAKPAWVPEYCENGNLVLMDDYVRANPQLLQACMDLILEQRYVSWSLPKKTTIVLTNNADDGSYNVNSLDEAQRSRFMNFEVAWDEGAWCEWAEKAGIDGRCINFVLNYSNELFSADEQGNRICNPRSYVMFARMIGGISDWENDDSLELITDTAKGCFKDEQGRFAKMFAAFLKSKMHMLIQPKKILTAKWADVKGELESALYDEDGQYRPMVASIIERRFVNFVNSWLESDDKTPISVVKNRILDFVNNQKNGGKLLFNPDLFIHMLKEITSKNKRQTQSLLFEPAFAAYLQ